MTLKELKQKAEEIGLDASNLKKVDLVHMIQRAEGFTACFGTAVNDCPYVDCCFIEDCYEVARNDGKATKGRKKAK